MSDEEKEAINNLRLNVTNVGISVYDGATSLFKMRDIQIVLNLIEKQSKEIEELKKQLDLDNECEIALNNRIMDLEKEIEELKQNIHLKEVYVLKTNDYIKGTNDADELCNKKWKDKIKAKIEEIDREIKFEQNEKVIIWLYKQKKVLQSLLEKE